MAGGRTAPGGITPGTPGGCIGCAIGYPGFGGTTPYCGTWCGGGAPSGRKLAAKETGAGGIGGAMAAGGVDTGAGCGLGFGLGAAGPGVPGFGGVTAAGAEEVEVDGGGCMLSGGGATAAMVGGGGAAEEVVVGLVRVRARGGRWGDQD